MPKVSGQSTTVDLCQDGVCAYTLLSSPGQTGRSMIVYGPAEGLLAHNQLVRLLPLTDMPVSCTVYTMASRMTYSEKARLSCHCV